MPLTFPSHAAAVLPLLRLGGGRLLPASALVVGSAAPDLIYLVGTFGAEAHAPRGLLAVCLPAGLVAFLVLELLLLPVVGPLLVALWPERGRAMVAGLVAPRPRPRGARAWAAVAAALVLGAATHQLWDGFTHAWLWPARALYPEASVAIFGRPILVARALQHASSALGLAIVIVYLRRRAWPEPAQVVGTRGAAARRLGLVLAAPLIGAAIAGGLRLRAPDPLLTRAVWNAAWSASAWFVLLLGASCLAARLVELRSARRGPRA